MVVFFGSGPPRVVVELLLVVQHKSWLFGWLSIPMFGGETHGWQFWFSNCACGSCLCCLLLVF